MARPPLNFSGDLGAVFPQGLAGIIYDCDGVMIDSAGANRFLYNQILAALDLPPISPQQEKMAFQATFQQALEYLVPVEFHHRLDAVCREVINYDRDIVPRIEVMSGYREFVEAAHACGLRQAMDTNRTEAGAYKILNFFHLPRYFDPVMSATVVEPKPSPEGPLAICNAWGVSPGQALFVGDSTGDRRAAEGAGVVFAGFGGIGGAIRVASWPELASLLWGGKDEHIR